MSFSASAGARLCNGAQSTGLLTKQQLTPRPAPPRPAPRRRSDEVRMMLPILNILQSLSGETSLGRSETEHGEHGRSLDVFN